MLLDFLLLAVGITLLVGGADYMVRGASALARALGVSPLIIGLTVVAFGTSAPELAINLIAAWHGNGEISFGNIVGSNIANIGLILGVAALAKPLEIHSTVITRELPMMLLATAATVLMGCDLLLRHEPSVYDFADGLMLLLLFCIFIHYTVSEVLRQRSGFDPLLRDAQEMEGGAPDNDKIGLNLLLTIGGLIALLGGGRITVDAAVALAEAFAVPRVLIGLTVVAVGTSLPELVTSVVATRRGQTDIAIGNVVGSNIFNLLFVMGLSATVRPIPVPASGLTDLMVMGLLSLLLLPFTITHRHRIVRWEGLVLLALYLAYTAWLTFSLGLAGGA
ncbi:MAG: calcium/sodium antiporter [Desulfobulbaceae bacterium]|nr:calcium/sodium antiporter [Desulfobulbaceae bacterium]